MDLRPFAPGEYIMNDDGSYSTERSRTVMDQSGAFINVPSLWKDNDGNTYDLGTLSDDQLADIAGRYAQKAKKPWQRFKNVDEAVTAAEERSQEGGAFAGTNLTKPDGSSSADTNIHKAIRDALKWGTEQ